MKIAYIYLVPKPNNAMKNKKLLAFLMILLSGCTPGLFRVYELLNTRNAKIGYIMNKWSIRDELACLQKAMDQTTDDSLRSLIRKQHELILSYQDILTQEDVVCYKPGPRPGPIPPPPPPIIPSVKNIVFFTRSVPEKIELYKNGELLKELKNGKFLELTNIYIVRLPGTLQLKSGDILTLKYTIQYQNNVGEKLNQEIHYTETY
jgi:hypothetical protein